MFVLREDLSERSLVDDGEWRRRRTATKSNEKQSWWCFFFCKNCFSSYLASLVASLSIASTQTNVRRKTNDQSIDQMKHNLQSKYIDSFRDIECIGTKRSRQRSETQTLWIIKTEMHTISLFFTLAMRCLSARTKKSTKEKTKVWTERYAYRRKRIGDRLLFLLHLLLLCGNARRPSRTL